MTPFQVKKIFSSRVLVLTFLTSCLLVTPDLIFSLFNPDFSVSRDLKALLFLIPLSQGLVLSPKFFSILTLIFFGILQVAQFVHIAYFGVHLSAFSLHLMQQEIRDVWTEGLCIWRDYIYILPMIIIPFYVVHYLNKKYLTRKSWGGVLLILGLFLYFGNRLWVSSSSRFSPNSRRITLDNSLKAFWGYFIIQYRHYGFKNYAPYSVQTNPLFQSESPVNIIYIIGESVNYHHMSLFGYDRNDTTPCLKKLALNENFHYMPGISGANSTLASCKFITNAIREPNNVRQTSLDTTNLFKLAKKSGFRTFYLSTQSDCLISGIGGANYIDHVVVKETDPLKIQTKKDLYLLKLIQKQNYGNKNFIVLHQSSVHSPYHLTYGSGYEPSAVFKGQTDPLLDDYDNAMLYNDSLISQIFEFFNKSADPFYIVFASDHSELFGDKGIWGHGSAGLLPEVAEIPVMVQSNDLKFLKKVKNAFAITHYEIAKLLAEVIGFDVMNPNEADEPNIFYINGLDYNGKCGYIRFTKDLVNKQVIYDPVSMD